MLNVYKPVPLNTTSLEVPTTNQYKRANNKNMEGQNLNPMIINFKSYSQILHQPR